MKCARCGAGESTRWARRLCRRCYDNLHDGNPDLLLDFPRVNWPGPELVAEAELVRARDGGTWAEVARTLGVSPTALARARLRHRSTQAVA